MKRVRTIQTALEGMANKPEKERECRKRIYLKVARRQENIFPSAKGAKGRDLIWLTTFLYLVLQDLVLRRRLVALICALTEDIFHNNCNQAISELLKLEEGGLMSIQTHIQLWDQVWLSS